MLLAALFTLPDLISAFVVLIILALLAALLLLLACLLAGLLLILLPRALLALVTVLVVGHFGSFLIWVDQQRGIQPAAPSIVPSVPSLKPPSVCEHSYMAFSHVPQSRVHESRARI